MLNDSPRGLDRPLFFRIALVFILTSAAVLSATVAFLYMQYPRRDDKLHRAFRKNLALYFDGMTTRLGAPPDRTKAARLAEELGLAMRIEGPGQLQAWWNSPALAEAPEVEFDGAEVAPGVRMGRAREQLLCVVKRQSPQGAFEVVYAFPGRPVYSLPLKQSLLLVGWIALILALSYATVRWLVIPVVRARERLLVDVSHELRSPLARMKLALEMLPKSANRQAIALAASEMETMLAEILETERMKSSFGALSKTALSLPALAEAVAGSSKALSPGVKIQKAADFPLVQADEAKAAIALRNVVENALKYSQGQKRPVEISFSSDASAVRVTVQDHGQGIPASDLKLVFEPFYRVDKSRTKKTGGYGLGLSLCREIMRAHGGEALIESVAGSGTRVSLVFPK